MTATLVDVRTPAPAAPAGLVRAYSGFVVEVADAARAREFYGDLLTLLGEQAIVLQEASKPRTLPDGGAHFAVRLTPPHLDRVVAGFRARGVEVHGYREDRPAEREHNRYVVDPDGNRWQLVAGPTVGLDHAAVEVHDVEWAETFYTQVLGGVVEDRVGWRMDDFTAASAWGEGHEDCAPGTRRWDRRYTTIEGNARVARPNAHFFVRFAPAAVLGVYLATEHRQEPPPEQFRGSPRICFDVTAVADLAERLRNIQVRCLYSSPETGGPFERHGSALFVRDPGGNFLEFREA